MSKSLKNLPVGVESFEEMRREEFYFVDKTGLIKELLNNRGKVNLEIVVNAGFDSIMERVIPSIFRFKIIDKDAVFFRVYNPVFPDACRAVFEQLGMVVSPPAAGGYDLDDPVRSTGT